MFLKFNCRNTDTSQLTFSATTMISGKSFKLNFASRRKWTSEKAGYASTSKLQEYRPFECSSAFSALRKVERRRTRPRFSDSQVQQHKRTVDVT